MWWMREDSLVSSIDVKFAAFAPTTKKFTFEMLFGYGRLNAVYGLFCGNLCENVYLFIRHRILQQFCPIEKHCGQKLMLVQVKRVLVTSIEVCWDRCSIRWPYTFRPSENRMLFHSRQTNIWLRCEFIVAVMVDFFSMPISALYGTIQLFYVCIIL